MIRFLTTAVVAVALVGCSSRPVPVEEPPKVYRVAMSQFGPEPVYSRRGWGLDPYPIPGKTIEDRDEESRNHSRFILPVFTVDLPSTTVREAVSQLASIGGYTTFVSKGIGGKRISLQMVGTLDEIGAVISERTNSIVHVDYEGRAIRVFEGGGGVEPRFAP